MPPKEDTLLGPPETRSPEVNEMVRQANAEFMVYRPQKVQQNDIEDMPESALPKP